MTCWRKTLLAFMAAGMLLSGCGTNPDAAHLYQLEKLFQHAEREASLTGIGPAGPEMSERVRLAGLYGEVVDYYLQAIGEFQTTATTVEKSSAMNLAVQSSMRMAALLGTTDQSDRAIDIYRGIPANFPELPAYHSIASFELARLYVRLRQWDSTLAIYHRLMYSYRPPADTVSGYDVDWLKLPLEIAEMNRLLERQDVAAQWLDTALIFYDRLALEYPPGTINMIAKTYASNTYRLKDDNVAAIRVLRTLIDSAGVVLPQAQVEIGNIFLEQLKNPDSAEAVFKTLVAQHSDSPAATIAQTKIAAILIEKGKNEEARELLRPLKQAYEKKGQTVAGIQLLMGRTYEQDGAWDRALNEYSWLVENFPELQQSLDVYLHIISRMIEIGNTTVAEQWQRNAVRHFDQVISANPNTELAALAQKNLARSWVLMKNWEQAAQAYQTLIDKYPPAPSRLQIYIELAAVYSERLGDREMGAVVLERLLQDYPNFQRRDEVQQRIDHLRSTKS
jgi:tetratricopeptide (TPR) repeat protein